jgi:hypothetical protein
VLDANDHRGLPFAIVDKRDARIYVFEPSGRLVGARPFCSARRSAIASFADAELRIPGRPTLDERTTPAGRFASQPGRNDKGEAIVWIDYQASLAIHRLRAAPAAERRAERLASPARDDKRISLGCVVVPVEFYESVVEPSLGRGRGGRLRAARVATGAGAVRRGDGGWRRRRLNAHSIAVLPPPPPGSRQCRR